jgi:hypothetical protein
MGPSFNTFCVKALLIFSLSLCCRLYCLDRTVTALFYMLIIWMLLSWSDRIIAWVRLTIDSVPQMFNIPILRAIPDMIGTSTGSTS